MLWQLGLILDYILKDSCNSIFPAKEAILTFNYQFSCWNI